MEDLNRYVAIYKAQLKNGDILIAYKELVKFVMRLRTNLTTNLSDQYSFAGILHGYMDYTYFYYSNDFLKSKNLKFGLVLNHVEMKFELWLLGSTVQVRNKYWELSKETKWNKNRTEMPEYSILEAPLVENPDFNNLDALAEKIETELIEVSVEILDHLKSI